MPLPTAFASLTAATGQELDNNFNALGVLCVLRCTVSGTNTLTMSLTLNTPTISVYGNYLVFSAVASATNTASVSASVGGLPTLTVYRDSPAGPVALIGREIVAGNSFLLLYDSALSGGSGGFHLINPASSRYVTTAAITVNSIPGVTLTAAQLTGNSLGSSVINRTGAAVGAFNDTTDTAGAIIAALPGQIVGSTFRVRMANSTGQTQTLLAGSGVGISGTPTTADGTTHEFEGVVTSGSTVQLYG